MVQNSKDFRPETFRPNDLQSIKIVGNIKSDGGAWVERRKFVLKNVYTNLEKLVLEAKTKNIYTSLAVFKPTKFLDFYWEPVEKDWDEEKLKFIESQKLQSTLFDSEDKNQVDDFEVVDKVPYKFKFKFEDDAGTISDMMIGNWEAGMLYWNSLKQHNGNEALACEGVRKKYFDDFAKTKDYYFFLGTTKLFQLRGPNPFIIIGDFYPKFEDQGLFE